MLGRLGIDSVQELKNMLDDIDWPNIKIIDHVIHWRTGKIREAISIHQQRLATS